MLSALEDSCVWPVICICISLSPISSSFKVDTQAEVLQAPQICDFETKQTMNLLKKLVPDQCLSIKRGGWCDSAQQLSKFDDQPENSARTYLCGLDFPKVYPTTFMLSIFYHVLHFVIIALLTCTL